jgi:hypothetical protein
MLWIRSIVLIFVAVLGVPSIRSQGTRTFAVTGTLMDKGPIADADIDL